MTRSSSVNPRISPSKQIGTFKAYLPICVALSIAAGFSLGTAVPAALHWLQIFEIGHVNLAVALLVWLMIFPTMVKVDFPQVRQSASWMRGFALTVTTNWLVKPITMEILATFFLTHLFSQRIPAEEGRGYVAGLILLGVAPCKEKSLLRVD